MLQGLGQWSEQAGAGEPRQPDGGDVRLGATVLLPLRRHHCTLYIWHPGQLWEICFSITIACYQQLYYCQGYRIIIILLPGIQNNNLEWYINIRTLGVSVGCLSYCTLLGFHWRNQIYSASCDQCFNWQHYAKKWKRRYIQYSLISPFHKVNICKCMSLLKYSLLYCTSTRNTITYF